MPPPTSTALIDVATVKEALKIPTATTSEDTVLGSMISRASILANKFAGRTFLQQTYTEYYDGDGTDTLMVNNYPIGAVTSLYDSTDRVFDSGSAIDVTDDVMIDADAGIVRLWNNAIAFNTGKANIKIVYTGGYALASMPYDIQEAVILIVQHQYRRIYQDQRIGLASETIGDHTMQYVEDWIPKKAKEILERYRVKHSANYGHS
jgi:uncharacterized phiE125 gp8 family phage protein